MQWAIANFGNPLQVIEACYTILHVSLSSIINTEMSVTQWMWQTGALNQCLLQNYAASRIPGLKSILET